MRLNRARLMSILFVLTCLACQLFGAELVTLSPANYSEYAPAGKKADAIFGDFVLRNDRITAVVADPDLWVGRSGSRKGGEQFYGQVIDLTRRDHPNDLLDMFNPFRHGYRLRTIQQARGRDGKSRQDEFPDEALAWKLPGREPQKKPTVELRIPFMPPAREVVYRLEDGKPYLEVVTHFLPTAKRSDDEFGVMLSMGTFPLDDSDALLQGIDADGHFTWVYDPWFGQAYGVYCPDFRLAATLYGPDIYQLINIDDKPASPRTVTHWLIPGGDMFQVRAALLEGQGATLDAVRFVVTDATGPVKDAQITLRRDDELFAAGRTDEHGVIEARLPKEDFELKLEAPARAAITGQLKASQRGEVKLTVPDAPILSVTVTDDQGRPLPCKVQLRGLGKTDDPRFGPSTADYGVRNVIYSSDGRISRPIPAGQYELIASHGPEYEIHREKIAAIPGRGIELAITLPHVVDSTGWIAANFENRTAVSRFVSNSSAIGRVLNLLAEGIDFAPATDIDHINTLSPAIEKLDATRRLATCPGVRMTWGGRKYAQRWHTAWPLPYVKGREDGGMLQRPQHKMLLSWLIHWREGEPLFVNIDEPNVRRKFMEDIDGDGKPEIGFGSISIDIHSPLPLAQAPEDRRGSQRIFDWLDAVGLGYTCTAIGSSDEPHNWHANAALRTYIRFDDTDLTKLDFGKLGDAIQQGRCIVSTGPLVDVNIQAKTKGTLGDMVVASPGGKATLRINAQAPSWINLDRVSVLVNGESSRELTFTRKNSPKLFAPAPGQFAHEVDLTLERDAFVVVVASGTGVNLGRDWRENPTELQVAVTNPIRIDVEGDGYTPSPMVPMRSLTLGGSEHMGSITTLKPVSAKPDAAPGRFQMPMKNRTDKPARGELSFQVNPKDAITFMPLEPKRFETGVPSYQGGSKLTQVNAVTMSDNSLKYQLAPDDELYVEFEAKLTPGHTPGGFWLYVPRQEKPVQRTPVGQYVEVAGYTVPLRPKLTGLKQFDEMMPTQTPYVLRDEQRREAGKVYLAATASGLAAVVSIDRSVVQAAGPRELTFYFTIYDKLELREYDAFYRPVPEPDIYAVTLKLEDDKTSAELTLPERFPATIPHRITRGDGREEVRVMIPFSPMRIPDPKRGRSFLMDVMLRTQAGEAEHDWTVFGSREPATDNVMFGRIHPE